MKAWARSKEFPLSVRSIRSGVALARRATNVHGLLFASVAFGLLLPECSLTDHYYVDYSLGGRGDPQTSGGSSEPGGGSFSATGGTEALGGYLPNESSNGGRAEAGAQTVELGGTESTGGTSSVAGGSLSNGGASETGGDVATNGGTESNGGFSWTSGRRGGGGSPSTGGNTFQPLCPDSVMKEGVCRGTDPQFCYKTCGPDSIGFKTETCVNGRYQEQDGCSFPEDGDYSCYRLNTRPSQQPDRCPMGVPRATEPCDVAACTLCYGGTATMPQYRDSTGMQKIGYCVCTDAGSWTCASVASWPCPGGNGCE